MNDFFYGHPDDLGGKTIIELSQIFADESFQDDDY